MAAPEPCHRPQPVSDGRAASGLAHARFFGLPFRHSDTPGHRETAYRASYLPMLCPNRFSGQIGRSDLAV